MKERDVLIIGAGPAGMFAANELIESGMKVTILELGRDPERRKSITYGVGGAGAFSDGKLNLTPAIGGDPLSFHRTKEDLYPLITRVDQTFEKFGGRSSYSGESRDALHSLKKKAGKFGIEFIAGKQRHIGTKNVREVISNFYRYLVDQGIEIILENNVGEIRRDKEHYILETENENYRAPMVIAAPGRSGAYWLRAQARKLGVEPKYGPIDVGIRVEFPAEIYDSIEEVMYDAKFRLRSDTYDDLVRTFCTNPRGYVVQEKYDGFVLVNGHAENEKKSNVTNFALLSRVELTDPVEDTTEYGRAIVTLANTIGGGKPILQRFKDLTSGHRSTNERLKRIPFNPTLKDYTPGDISMALPDRITINLIEALNRLNNIIEGVTADSTLIYAPEIKFYDTTYDVNKHMETSLQGFYVAGDASGHSRGIVYAAITGILAARNTLN